MKYKVLIPEDITEPGKKYLIENDCELIILEDASVENICRHVADCDAILARTADYPREVFEHGKILKVLARHGVGYDNVDLEAATEYNVQICNTPLSNADSVAEHTIALILACAKNIVTMDQRLRLGKEILASEIPFASIAGKTLGIIGCGRIGRQVAKKAALGLNMIVLAYRRHPHINDLPDYINECSNIDDVFMNADFVSLHTALNDSTRNLVSAEKLALMKNTAFLINTSRGAVVEEEALIKALTEKRIAGAGLDVFVEEPPRKENPLLQFDNVIVSPHNAALTQEALDRMGLDAAKSIIEVLHGKAITWPVNRLN